MYLGAHVSISKGLLAAVKTAAEIGGNTFQFFTRNPRGGNARELQGKDLDQAHQLMAEMNFGPPVAHAPYTYNLASTRPEVRDFSIRTIKEDLLRVAAMKTPYLVLHVGTHGGQGEETGLKLVVQGLQEILPFIPEGVYLLIEGMAGEGTELGYSFTQLRLILESCDFHEQVGICLDSCHLTGAGYDLSRLDSVKTELDREIGLERLKVFHLNDSLFPLGSRRDRHAKLGEGYLGLDIIKAIACDKDIQKIPLILETPNDNNGYAEEIAHIKKMCGLE